MQKLSLDIEISQGEKGLVTFYTYMGKVPAIMKSRAMEKKLCRGLSDRVTELN